jgi:hypothetical protein
MILGTFFKVPIQEENIHTTKILLFINMKKELIQEIEKMNELIDSLCESDMSLYLKRRGISEILDDMIQMNLEYVDENTQPYDFVHYVIQDTMSSIYLDYHGKDEEEMEESINDEYFDYILDALLSKYPDLKRKIGPWNVG